MQITIQTKIKDKASIEVLERMSAEIGKIRGALLRDLLKGKDNTKLKKQYNKKYGLLARQYNSLSTEVRALIKSAKELKADHIEQKKKKVKNQKTILKKLEKKLARLKKNSFQIEKKRLKLAGKKKKLPRQDNEKRIENAQQKKKLEFQIHHKKRKLEKLEITLEKLKKEKLKICLGTKKRFLAQFHLEENKYENHAQWKEDFQKARNNRIFFIGSKDESFGNQNCQLLGNKVRVRNPRMMENEFGEYSDIPVKFSYGGDVIQYALKQGQAISYRFVRKNKKWYLHLSTEREKLVSTTRKDIGAIGIDINKAHLAWAETNRHGNLVNFGKILTPTQDKRSDQVTAIFSDAIRDIVLYAKIQEKPIIIESLDFQNKKDNFDLYGKRYRRMLSSFAYKKFYKLIASKASKEQVQLISVNPAYSSVIAKFKFALMYGISGHIAASLLLARRAFRFSEKLSQHIFSIFQQKLPTKNALRLAEHRRRHVWAQWNIVSKAVSNREIRVDLVSWLVAFSRKST